MIIVFKLNKKIHTEKNQKFVSRDIKCMLLVNVSFLFNKPCIFATLEEGRRLIHIKKIGVNDDDKEKMLL